MSFTDQMRAAHAEIASEVSRVAEVARDIKSELGIYSKAAEEARDTKASTMGMPMIEGFFPTELGNLRATYDRLEDAMRDLADIFEAIKACQPSQEAGSAR